MTLASTPRPTPERLDELWPPCGPCWFCGGPDKRHRMWDTLRGRHVAGESIAYIKADFMRYTEEQIRAGIAMGEEDKIMRKYRFRRKKRKAINQRGFR